MPIHDWTRVNAGTFHGFHTAWVTHLGEALNNGLLPPGFYALPEQHFGKPIADVLTLHTGTSADQLLPPQGGVLLLDAPPKVSRKLTASTSPGALRRTLTIRHVSGHRVIALLEVVSPANKDRARHVDEFVSKAIAALNGGIHLLVIDLFPPGLYDPWGMHGSIWQRIDEETAAPEFPASTPLTLAAYVGRPIVEAFVEPLALGAVLPDMPLFLDSDRYINAPLEKTYQAAFRGLPTYWRDVLELGNGS